MCLISRDTIGTGRRMVHVRRKVVFVREATRRSRTSCRSNAICLCICEYPLAGQSLMFQCLETVKVPSTASYSMNYRSNPFTASYPTLSRLMDIIVRRTLSLLGLLDWSLGSACGSIPRRLSRLWPFFSVCFS